MEVQTTGQQLLAAALGLVNTGAGYLANDAASKRELEIAKLGLQISAAAGKPAQSPGASSVNGVIPTTSKQLISGVDNTVLLGGAAVGLVVLLLVMRSNK